MAVMEVILKAVDQVSGVVDGIGEKTASAGKFMEENWMAIGAGAAVAGTAIEGVARSQAPLTEQTNKLANAMEMSSDEVRGMATDLSDATFPLDDVLGLMEAGRQQGIESAEGLKDYASYWDMVGDATGENAVELGKAGGALRAVGIAAGEEKEALDAFGYIAQETTGDIGDFLHFVERSGPELREMGADVDDAAAVMGVLEHEFGMTARTARQEFQTAVNEADGDMDEMLDTLGVSGDKFDEYRGKVEESSDVIEDNAKAHEDTKTVLEDAQAWAADLMYSYGDLLGAASSLAPVMMGLGPIIKGVSAAKAGLAAITKGGLIPSLVAATKSAWGFTAALLANPIVWIVAAVIGLIAAIYLLWKNWDEVSAFLVESWEWVKEAAVKAFGAVIEFFKELPEKAWEIFTDLGEGILELFEKYHPLGIVIKNWDEIMEFLGGLPGRVWEIMLQIIDRVTEWAGDIYEQAKEGASNVLETVVEYFSELPGKVGEFLAQLWENFSAFVSDMIAAATEFGAEVLETITDFFSQLPGRILEYITDIWNSWVTWRNDMYQTAKEAGAEVLSAIVEFFSQLPGKIAEFLATGLSNIISWGTDMVSEAKSAASDMFDAVVEGIKGLPGELLDIGRNMISNLAKGITDRIGRVTGAIGDVAGGIRNFLPFSPAKEGPLRHIPDFTDHLITPAEEALGELKRIMEQGIARAAGPLRGGMPNLAMGGTAGGGGGAAGGGDTVTNYFRIGELVVRDERDIEEIAERLFQLQRKRGRSS